jgi:hypothetical protein
MPTRSKFTSEQREIIVEALRRGNSRRVAAALAGIDHRQIARWLRRGQDASAGSTWREFAEAVAHAEAVAAGEMMEIVRRDAVVEGNARSAQWWLERRDPAFRGKPEETPTPQAPTVIQLRWPDRGELAAQYTTPFAEGSNGMGWAKGGVRYTNALNLWTAGRGRARDAAHEAFERIAVGRGGPHAIAVTRSPIQAIVVPHAEHAGEAIAVDTGALGR